MKKGDSFHTKTNTTETLTTTASSGVKYDLIGKLCEATLLTRRTISAIMQGILVARFGQFRTNPENFIMEASRLINEQKATMIVEHLTYDTTTGIHDAPDIFTQRKEDLSKGFKATKHIYDYVFTVSGIERTFVGELDASSEVVVYAKLPRTFTIPTPVGNYNPDWAIAFKHGEVKYIYFIAETKGTLSSMSLRKIEEDKVACARRFFAKITSDQVKYDVVNSYGKLMELVKPPPFIMPYNPSSPSSIRPHKWTYLNVVYFDGHVALVTGNYDGDPIPCAGCVGCVGCSPMARKATRSRQAIRRGWYCCPRFLVTSFKASCQIRPRLGQTRFTSPKHFKEP